MTTIFYNVNNVYTTNKNPRKEDVETLVKWVKDQPHLPDINEAQAILFLHRWDYQLEVAKTAIDTYFTVKTYRSDIFLTRNPLNTHVKESVDMAFCTFLSQKSFKGYSVYLIKIMTRDVARFSAEQCIKCYDMVLSLNMYEKGPSEEYVVVWDVTNFELEMIAKAGLIVPRIFWYYIQKVSSMKCKQWHLINPVPHMDKVLALVKPFLEKELADELYIHQTLAELYKHVPQQCLPNDYGGSEESVAALHGKMKKKILENVALFDWENGQIADESKRSTSTDIVDYLERGSIRNGKFVID